MTAKLHRTTRSQLPIVASDDRRNKRLRISRRVLGEELSRLVNLSDLRDTFVRDVWRFTLLERSEQELIVTASDHSMQSLKRLYSLYRLATSLEGTPGVFAEFGVARGGSAGLLGVVGSRQGRDLWLFDSFEGLPRPTTRDGADAARIAGGCADGALEPIGRCVGGVEEVRTCLRGDFGIPSQRTHFVQGWFQDTRGSFPDLPIALLHLDGDWYESVKFVLEAYHHLVVPGGVIVLDDYGAWPGCREAADEFLGARRSALLRVGSTQAYLVQ